MSLAKSWLILAKWQLNASAILDAELVFMSPISISAITYFICWRGLSSLTSCQVLRRSFLLAARWSRKYLRLAYLIKLLTSFLAVLKSSQQDWSLARSAFFFRKSLLRILRINSCVILGDFLFPILFDLIGACLSIQVRSWFFQNSHISLGWENRLMSSHWINSRSARNSSWLKFLKLRVLIHVILIHPCRDGKMCFAN